MVDDDDMLRAWVARCLVRAGHTVSVAGNGVEALDMLGAASFDLVVTDVVMPELEGLGLLRRLKKLSDPPAVITMSGGGAGSAGTYLELAANFGAAATLEKPFDENRLLACVRDVMDVRSRRAGDASP